MLVLSRHASETIRIGDDIVVSIQRISGNRVIIGIDAPQEVAIRRGELAFEGDSVEVAAPKAGNSRPATKSSSKSAAAVEAGGRGLASRVRTGDRPVIAPMGEQSVDWSGSHVS